MHGASGGGKRARIEIIPLIDIIFFLLATFIMVSLSMTKNSGMQVNFPTVGGMSTAQSQDAERPVTVVVMAQGKLTYSYKNTKEEITLAQLPLRLQNFKSSSKDKDPKVIICGDTTADYKDVVAALDEARKTGVKVSLSTDKR